MKSYLITDPKYYTSNINTFKEKLENIFTSQTIDYACFRDKSSSNFEELASIFCEAAKKHNIKKYFLNTDYELASKLGATGVHLTSTQFDEIQIAKEMGLEVIISTHNEDEIVKAIENGVDMITYSPIFFTPNKGEPKGIDDLQNKCDTYTIPIIALGGIIDVTQVVKIEKTKAIGFASIRYFIK